MKHLSLVLFIFWTTVLQASLPLATTTTTAGTDRSANLSQDWVVIDPYGPEKTTIGDQSWWQEFAAPSIELPAPALRRRSLSTPNFGAFLAQKADQQSLVPSVGDTNLTVQEYAHATTINRAYSYIPADSSKGRCVLVVIHGSRMPDAVKHIQAGPTNPAYFDPCNQEVQTFRDIMRFGAEHAYPAGKRLDLLSFGWSGDINIKARDGAALAIACYLNQYYKDAEKIILAHSHGCTVACKVSHHMTERPIDLLLFFSWPRRPKHAPVSEATLTGVFQNIDATDNCDPENFKTLFSFFSQTDSVAAIGSISERTIKAAYRQHASIESNFDQLEQNAYKTHAGLGVIATAAKCVMHGVAFHSAVSSIKVEETTDHKDLIQDARRLITMRVFVDGANAGHDSTIKAAAFLSIIFERLRFNYFAHSAANSAFALNIACAEQTKVMLAIQEAGDFKRLTAVNSIERLLVTQQAVDKEALLSDAQNSRFCALYGRTMQEAAPNLAAETLRSVREIATNCVPS